MNYTEIKTKSLNIFDCGVQPYNEMLEFQKLLLEKRFSNEISNTVVLVEHDAVITLGARESENKLLFSEEEYESKNIELVHIKRGGGATVHNRGQLVIYPIVDLRFLGLGVNEYIRELEEIGIELLSYLGLESERRKGYPGLWVGSLKIASIGVRVSRGVAYHGIAINIKNDLSLFDMIVPCGIDGVSMTSVSVECFIDNDMSYVKKIVSEILVSRLSREGNL